MSKANLKLCLSVLSLTFSLQRKSLARFADACTAFLVKQQTHFRSLRARVLVDHLPDLELNLHVSTRRNYQSRDLPRESSPALFRWTENALMRKNGRGYSTFAVGDLAQPQYSVPKLCDCAA